jgi:7-cyano-7-deazaguanine synthase in queuosine biosynthesis
MIELKCGPINDERTITLEIPNNIKSIGILHSGGTDSTILLHLLTKYFPNYPLTVFTINKVIGDNIINSNRVLDKMGLNNLKHEAIDIDKSTPHYKIVPLTIEKIIKSNIVDFIFLAGNSIPLENLDTNFSGPIRIKGNILPNKISRPFIDIFKYHIIDIYYRENVEYLLEYTHSCTEQTVGYCDKCWFCSERKWAFKKLNKIPIMGQ